VAVGLKRQFKKEKLRFKRRKKAKVPYKKQHKRSRVGNLL
jgi:hypothetical protein